MSKIAEILHWNSVKNDGLPPSYINVMAWIRFPDGDQFAVDLYHDGASWCRAGADGLMKVGVIVTHWALVNGPKPNRAQAVRS